MNQDTNKFIVSCRKKPNSKSKYDVFFQYNKSLVDNIKLIPYKLRKWNPSNKSWTLDVKGLYSLMKFYKGSDKIHFAFDSIEEKKKFIDKIKKIDQENAENKRIAEQLEKSKKLWVTKKEEFQKNYLKYWDKIHRHLKKGVKLYPHQVVAALFLNETKNALLSMEMGTGKAQDLDSKLLTPNGWVRMGDISVGDYVIGSSGEPIKVLGVYPQKVKKIYEITFNDGSKVRSCDEHLWNVNTQSRIFRDLPYKTLTLKEIISNGLKYDNGNNKHYIPIVKPILFENKNLNIDPYVLGCLLGNGSLITKYVIGFTSTDQEIIDEINKRIPNNHVLKQKINDNINYYLVSDGRKNLINRELRKLNLKEKKSHEKHIPFDYKFSSITQRLELLRGIFDTNGFTQKNGDVGIILSSKKIIDDIKFIVETLGGIARYEEKKVFYNNEYRIYHKLNINLPSEFIPFKISRKIDNYIKPTKYLPNRAIVDIKYYGKKEAQCILVDSKDSLYVTDNCVLTHNTLSSIAYVEMNDMEKVFVITPNSLKFNYYYEVEKFTESKAHIVNWKDNVYSIEESKYIIMNYEFFNPSDKNKMDKKFKDLGVDCIDAVVADESHRIKNDKSNTYKNFKRLFNKNFFRDNVVSKVFLSGTPAPNAAYELYTVLNQISPIDFATKTHFYEYYCGMTYNLNGFGWEKDISSQNLEELFHKIAPYTYRVKKEDVVTDLPDKIYQKLILELDKKEQDAYNEIESDVSNEIFSNVAGNPLTIMMRLRQFSSALKINRVKEIIDSLMETGEKMVVVDVFKPILYKINELYPDISVVHTGDQSVEERSRLVKEFQNPNSKVKLFLGSIQTCNYGLTLTAASKLLALTLPFSVGEYDQVSDRLHRIGQKDTVNIYLATFRNTIDEYVFASIESKRKEIKKVIDNEDYESNVDESVIGDVIKKLKEKHG